MIRAFLILALTATPALAQNDGATGTPPVFPEPAKEAGPPPRAPQVRAWEKRHELPRKRLVVDVDEPRGEQTVCVAPVLEVGDEARTKDAAELQARQHWLKRVRFDHGEKYLSIEHARDVHFQCSRSDFPITGGKVGAVIDNITHQWRCKIRATPCTAPMAREEK